jgi:Ca2+/Na+ antiporter
MISSKILVPVIIGVACILALLVGTNLAVDSDQTMVYTGLFFLVFVLMVFAREYWWLAMFIAVAFGGYVYFGFKILAHESMLALAMAGLLPSVALNPHSEFNASRPKLPWYFYAAGAYLIFQIFYSISVNNPHGFIEYGNIVRAYAYGFWPLVFVFLFRYYGRSDYLNFAIWLLQSVYLFRALMTLATIYFPSQMVLPGINFILPGNDEGGGGLDDLRFPGHGIVLLACAILLKRPSLPVRLWQWLLIVFALFCQMWSGGRLLLVASILTIVAAFVVARMWKTVIAATTAAIFSVVFLNLFPQTIYNFGYRWQRAASVLLLTTKDMDTRFMTEGSDLWHERLGDIAYERWTSSARTFFIGTGIKPWDIRIARESSPMQRFEAQLGGAADTGGYESGLWIILTPSGLIGLLLYCTTLAYFVIPNARRFFREKPRGFNLTVVFLGTYPAVEWLLFSPRSGGYPAIELLFASTAFYYLRDQEKNPQLAATEAAAGEDSTYAGADDSWT